MILEQQNAFRRTNGKYLLHSYFHLGPTVLRFAMKCSDAIICLLAYFVWYFSQVRSTELHPHTALQAGGSRVRFPMVSLEFFIDTILRPHYGPGVDSASNRNEYQEYFLEVKVAGA